MKFLAGLFVGKPLNIVLVDLVFVAGYLVARFGSSLDPRRTRPLLIAAVAWGAYAAWEWLIQARTPEADIRVDLLLIWPALALLSAWALFRAIR